MASAAVGRFPTPGALLGEFFPHGFGLPQNTEGVIPRTVDKKHVWAGEVVAGQSTEIKLLSTLSSPLVWTGTDFKSYSDYTYVLSKSEVVEIEAALGHFKACDQHGHEINPETFPLPTLANKLKALKQELFSGRGFINLRGLNPHKYSPEDNILLFVGLSKHLANRLGKQDSDGYMLGHIRNATQTPVAQALRPFRDSNVQLTFHTDNFTDILGIQTRDLAKSGGGHYLASIWKIYNELLETRPDVLRTLAEPNWYFEDEGPFEFGKGRALLFIEDGKVSMNYVRYMLLGRPGLERSPHLPKCTPAQVEALDILEALARKNQLLLDMQPGDLTYVNNLGLIHAREAFEDDETHVRYLVRLWLKDEAQAWKTPQALQEGFNQVFYNDDVEEKWNILPQPRLQFKLYQTLGP